MRKLLQGTPPKQVVLLTATPVNNSLWDLYHQLGYFIRNDAALADAGIASMKDRFAEAMAVKPDDLTPDLLFDVLDTLAVRRTRSFIKRWYRNDRIEIDGELKTIEFPTPRVHKVSYDLDQMLPGFFERIAKALDPDCDPADGEVLSLARYEPSSYLLAADEGAAGYERQIAGLLRSGMLKRFESSPHAFANTCERMAKSCDAFVSLLEAGHVATGEALADWAATDSDDLDEIDAWLDHRSGSLDDASRYNSRLLAERATADSVLLRSLAQEARTVTRSSDPNLAALVEELVEIAAEAAFEGIGESDVRNRRKVLIFSYFADTVKWVYKYLADAVEHDERLACYRGRIASLTGSRDAASSGSKERVVWGFAPVTSEAPDAFSEDRFDILVCTDVLAEGVNLQQARHIVNYDLPWNPMRLVQRHGRIDRIGSPHSEVFIRCVFPDSRLDDLLNLEERLNHKIKQAAASIGTPQVLPHQRGRDKTYTETREEIERLQRQDAGIFEDGRTRGGALSGEEFRQELRQAVEHYGMQDEIESLPCGSGSGMAVGAGTLAAGRRGYVFCVRVADDPKPLFRYVELDVAPRPAGTGLEDGTASAGEGAVGGASADKNADGDPLVLQKTLDCLEAARPADGFDTPRVLDDATADRAFDAWEIASADVVARWNQKADKAFLEPKIPAALRKATEILRANPPAGYTQEAIDAAIDSLSAPLAQRVVNAVRETMRGADDAAAQARNICDLVRELGLEPYVPPDPLPEITSTDVQLVCWQALV